jgi:hypothetical protein
MDIPAYLWIDTVIFTTSPDKGTASSKIPCVEVHVKGKRLGIFELPALIPVLAEGDCEVMIRPCCYLDGVVQWIPPNPFYKNHTAKQHLEKGKIDTIVPEFSYESFTKFKLMEDFESAGLHFKTGDNFPTLEKTSDSNKVFRFHNENNNYSGCIYLPYHDSIYYFEFQTITPVDLNIYNSSYCYLEMNCKTTHPIKVGVYLHASSTSLIYEVELANVNASTDGKWRKLYINLTTSHESFSIVPPNELTGFDVYVSGVIPQGEIGEFLFDNFKIVYQ